MILDYYESSEWLKYIFNKSILTNREKESLLSDADNTCCGYSVKYFEENNIDIIQYAPFFETIQDDIRKFSMLTHYGCNKLFMYWPYNKQIEDKLIELGLKSNRHRQPNMYNDLTEIKYEYDYDPCYLGNMMNTFGYYNKGYYDEYSIRLYHFVYNSFCQSFGGISLIIDRLHNDIHIFGIGEDDGWFFPETVYYHDYEKSGINQYELWQLCSIVNDIHKDKLDNQLIIDKLYKEYKKYNEQHK